MNPSGQPAFTHGTIFPREETRQLEFKQVVSRNPLGSITNTADEYAVAFLNSEGGTIYWGIEDATRRVVGVSLPSADRDLLRQKLNGKLREISPVIDPTRFRLEIHAVANAPTPDLFVVELTVPQIANADPFYTGGGEAFVRVDGTNRKLNGPALTEWIRHRSTVPANGALDPKLQQHVRRVRQVFEAHSLQPTHWARFFKLTNAPFTIRLTDIRDDHSLLQWIDEQKLAWITETFLIRREWLDGENANPQRGFHFDKDPEYFYETLNRYLDDPITESGQDSPTAYFIRWGGDKEWAKHGDHGIFMVIRFPVARMSDELFVYRYLCDFQPYSWEYGRTHIQFLSWIRLLFHVKHVYCHGCEISHAEGKSLLDEEGFLHPLLADRAIVRTHVWHPDDYALFPEESRVSKATPALKEAIKFLLRHHLPINPDANT